MRFRARMAWRAWAARPGRFALGGATLALATAAAAAAFTLRAESARAVAGELAAFGPNVTTRGPELDAEVAMAAARRTFGQQLQAGTPVLAGGVEVRGATVGVLGLSQEAVRALFPWWQGAGEPGVWAGRRLAWRLRIAAGDEIEIGGRRLAVRAVVTTGDVEDDRLILPLGMAQEILGRPGRATRLALRVAGNVAQGEADGVRFVPVYRLAEADRRILGRVDGILVASLVGLGILTAVAVGGLFAATLHERRREAGLMRALGAGAADVVGIVVREAALLAAVAVPLGYALGLVAGGALVREVLDRGASWRVESLAGIGLVLVAAAAGIAVPARRAVAVAPASLLRGE